MSHRPHPCDQELRDYIRDKLAPKRRRKLFSHLGRCPQCAKRVQDYFVAKEFDGQGVS